jgi:hypothetical protein
MSYTNNSLSIIGGTGITITPTTNTGATTITVAAAGAGLTTIRIATTTPVVLTSADDVVSVQVPGPVPVAVTLPAGVTGTVFTVKDGLGLASPATPITITATAGTIDSAATATISAPFGALTFIYSGTQWLIL